MSDADRVCLVSPCKCGCGAVIAAAVENPERPNENDDWILGQVKAGYEIRRMGVVETRAAKWGCSNEKQTELEL